MRFVFNCAQCGTSCDVYRSPSYKGAGPKYCSQACNGASKLGTGRGQTVTHEFNCAQCGVLCSVYRPPSAPTARFCSVQCIGASQIGEGNPSFTGGRHVGVNGYVYKLDPSHPAADSRGYVYEHRWVMERAIGRFLRSEEVVHHINRVRSDNRLENLMLLASQAEHLRLHRQEDSRG